MLKKDFNKIAKHIDKYVGMEVRFKHYIPSADKWVVSVGRIGGLIEHLPCNFLIFWYGWEKAIYYKHVTLP